MILYYLLAGVILAPKNYIAEGIFGTQEHPTPRKNHARRVPGSAMYSPEIFGPLPAIPCWNNDPELSVMAPTQLPS
jgi:hypothetical protein